MTEQEKNARDEKFIAWAVKGNRDAIEALKILGFVAHLWDDLVDGDRVRTAEEISRAFWMLLVDLPSNPFWRAVDGQMVPVLREGINAWLDANVLEKRKGDETAVVQAFTLRTAYNMLLTSAAYIVGGYEWMRTVSMAVRDDRSLTDGSFAEYVQAMETGG